MRDVQQEQTPSKTASQAEFRQVMGLFTTGVCIVSVGTGDEVTAAMTVNSFVSVSLDPMLVSWNLQNRSSQFDLYSQADHFAVSILADHQGDLAQRYATRGDSLLNSEDFDTSDHGLQVIAGALGYLECRRWSEFAAGDHTMIFGEVMGLRYCGDEVARNAPLGFFNGKFCSIGSS